jgi:hypothetical protein
MIEKLKFKFLICLESVEEGNDNTKDIYYKVNAILNPKVIDQNIISIYSRFIKIKEEFCAS